MVVMMSEAAVEEAHFRCFQTTTGLVEETLLEKAALYVCTLLEATTVTTKDIGQDSSSTTVEDMQFLLPLRRRRSHIQDAGLNTTAYVSLPLSLSHLTLLFKS